MRNKRHQSRQASRTEAIPHASFVKNSTPRSSTEGRTGRGPKSTVQVDFLELEDGTLVEMIEDPNDPTKSLIATCNNGQIRQMEKLGRGNQVFVPIPRDADIIRHVRLAKGTTPYVSVLELFAGILRVLRATLDLLRALALPLAEEKEYCEGLLLLLKGQESLREVLSVQQSAVLNFLYEEIHSSPELNGLRIVALTESVNANLRRRGESGELSEKKVSNILTSLHLTNRTRTNVGFVLWLSRETREEIHSQACTYGANAGLTPQMSADCELCQIASERPTSGGSMTKPLKEKESERVEVNARERREHREHGKRKARRKSARAVLAARPCLASAD